MTAYKLSDDNLKKPLGLYSISIDEKYAYDLRTDSERRNVDSSSHGMLCHCCKRQTVILILLCLSSVSIAQAISLFPPFYPKLAEEKGASPSKYGFILGSNCLVMFFLTPYVGKRINTIGIKFAFTSGMMANGVCCISSGFLDQMAPGVVFISMSILIRVLQAVGNSGVIMASFMIMALEFPDRVSRVFGITRILLNVGHLIGPIIGGALYEFDGYRMPFIALGSFQCVVAIICLLMLPGYEGVPTMENLRNGGPSYRRILSIPHIWVPFSCFIVNTMTLGFLTLTLEPRILRQLSLRPTYMGLLFGLRDFFNCLSALAFGWIGEKMVNVKQLLIVCSLGAGLSLFLLDPPSFGTNSSTLPLIILGLILNGIGTGGQQVGAILECLRATVNVGYPNDPSTQGCIAGLWSSLSGLGRFISRSGNGFLLEVIGHAGVTVLACVLNILLALITLCYLLHSFYKSTRRIGENPDIDSRGLLVNYVDVETDATESFYQTTAITSSCEFQRSQAYTTVL